MGAIGNLDLLSVALAIAGIGILAAITYFSGSRTNRTNIAFLLFSVVTIIWSILNYAYYSVGSEQASFWMIRAVIFFGAWHAFTFYNFCLVFPKKEYGYSKNFKYFLIPLTTLVSIVTLTPLAFKEVLEVTPEGTVTSIQNGPGMGIFSIFVGFLIASGIYKLSKKVYLSQGDERVKYLTVFSGTLVMFALIITFNIIFPAFLDNPSFIPLSAVFIFPFILFTAYAILKHRLFNVKAAWSGLLVFFLSIVSFLNIVFAESTVEYFVSILQFVLILIFGASLIRGVIKEVMQREEIQELAKNLEKANVRLKELDELKSEFVSIASHQLRSPLTAIKGYASLILEGSFGDINKATKEAVQKIFESSKLMTVSVQDFLDVSRIEQGRMKYNFEDCDLEKIVRTVVEEQTPIAQEKNLKMNLRVDDAQNFMIHADLGKIKQVLNNLIDNSIKYTPKGSINVVMCRIKDRIHVEIRDTGVGISKETLPRLFDKFVRSKNAHHVNVTGTGLGLYVVKKMIETHGGKVWATSEGEGEGSIFHIELRAL